MGLLDQVIGNVLGGALGGARDPRESRGGGGLGDVLGGGGQGRSGMSPVMMAILALIAGKAVSGGLGGMFRPTGGAAREEGAGYGEDDGPVIGRRGDDGGLGSITDGMYQRDMSGTAPQAGTERGGADAPDGGGILPGGLDDLIEMFQRNGRGRTIDSWIGSGANERMSPDDLGQALDDRTIDALERQTGLPRGDLLGQLSELLPGVIDQLTPRGRRPPAEERDEW